MDVLVYGEMPPGEARAPRPVELRTAVAGDAEKRPRVAGRVRGFRSAGFGGGLGAARKTSPERVLPASLTYLALVMLGAAITGFGRTYEAADGSETKTPPVE